MVFSLFSKGIQSKHVNVQDDLTILIDSKKYQSVRHSMVEISSNKTKLNECIDSNEEYRKCGDSCVISCRYASSPSEIEASKNDCAKTECVEGCFCKDGFVRHQNKCILPKECPARSNKSIEAADGDHNTVEHQQRKPFCISNNCECDSGGCAPPPPPPPKPCKPPGCKPSTISIFNHNQAISHGNSHVSHGHPSPPSPPPPPPVHVHVTGIRMSEIFSYLNVFV